VKSDQGIRTVSAAVERADKGAQIASKHGARFLEHYWTVGPYDVVAVVEAPDDESVTAVFREIGTAGNARPTIPVHSPKLVEQVFSGNDRFGLAQMASWLQVGNEISPKWATQVGESRVGRTCQAKQDDGETA
jgi:uncharacterized protein with GYD domain